MVKEIYARGWYIFGALFLCTTEYTQVLPTASGCQHDLRSRQSFLFLVSFLLGLSPLLLPWLPLLLPTEVVPFA